MMRQRAVLRSFLMLVLVSVLLSVSVFCSFSWFSKNLLSGRFGFSGGSLGDNFLEVALLTRTSADAEPTESAREYYPCEGGRFLVDHYPTQGGETYSVALSDLSFGVIDNVARVKPENRVFLRLTVPKDSGDTVEVKLYYGAYEDGGFAELYKNAYEEDGKTVSHQVKVGADEMYDESLSLLDGFHAVESEEMANDCYISYSVLVSNEEIAPTALGGTTFYGSDGKPAVEGSGSFYRVNAYDADSEGIMLKNEDYENAGDYYYVYVCIEPNLAVFGYSIEYISGIMPCYVFFKVNASFTVYRGMEVTGE